MNRTPNRSTCCVIALLTATIAFSLAAQPVIADLRIATYNLLSFSTSVSSDPTRVAAYKTVLSAVDADVIAIEEIRDSAAVSYFLNNVLNASGGPGWPTGSDAEYAAASFTNTSSTMDIALFYRPAKVTEISANYITLSTSPRITPRWRLRPVVEPSGESDFYIYAMHLHSTNVDSRVTQATTVRNHANSLPTGSHFFYVGDFNIDTSAAPSYQKFTCLGASSPCQETDPDGQAWDPMNPNGSYQGWHANSSYADFHTQSPHDNNPGAPGSSIGGGMDDRFDFLLLSTALHDGVGLDLIPGSYTIYGNDGLHYNDDINDPPTIPEGSAMADALHAAADHLPVYLDLQDPVAPPEIASISPISFGLVHLGGEIDATVFIENTGDAAATDLVYSFSTTAGFEAPTGAFSAPSGTGNQHILTAHGVTLGNQYGTLTVHNNSSNDPELDVVLSVGVVLAGDMTLNNVVDTGDIPGFVEVLLAPSEATSLTRFLADMDSDGTNDARDIQLFLEALTE